MSEAEQFKAELGAYWQAAPNKSDAARRLQVGRQQVYKYVSGSVTPRMERRDAMIRRMRQGQDEAPPSSVAFHPERALRMRQLLVELMTLLDLDEPVRGGTLQEDG